MANLFSSIVLSFTSKATHFFANPAPDALTFLHQLVVFTRSPRLDLETYQEYAKFWSQLL